MDAQDDAKRWHLIAGDWRPVEGELRASFLARVTPRLRAVLPDLDDSRLVVSRLALPFYRWPEAEGPGGLDLYEVAIPDDVDALGLRRWTFHLWDAADDLVWIDWQSATLHEVNDRVGLRLGEEGTAERDDDVLRYLAFFCSLIAVRNEPLDIATPLVVVGSQDALGWGGAPPPVSDGLAPPRLEAGAVHARVVHGQALHAAMFRVDPSGVVEMLDDDPLEAIERLPLLFIGSWSGVSFACCAPWATAEGLELEPRELVELVRDRRSGSSELGDAPASSGEGSRYRARRALALRAHVGGGLFATLRVRTTVELAAPGARVDEPLQLSLPVHVEGDVTFRGAQFLATVDLSHWVVQGRIDGRDARFASNLRLSRFRVANEIPRRTQDIGGAAQERQHPRNAVALGGARIEGSLELEGLVAAGAVDLERVEVSGSVILDDAECWSRREGCPALSANDLRVRASLHLRRASWDGGVSLKRVRVGGDLDASGVLIPRPRAFRTDDGQWADGLLAARATVEGDLLLNAWHHCAGPSDLRPTLIAGDLSLASTRVGGGIEAFALHVTGDADLRGITVAQSVKLLGLLPAGGHEASEISPIARMSHVGGNLLLQAACVQGDLWLGGTAVGKQLGLTGTSCAILWARPADGGGLPLHVGFALEAEERPRHVVELSRASIGALEIEALQAASGAYGLGPSFGSRARICGALVRVPEAAVPAAVPRALQELEEAWSGAARAHDREEGQSRRAGVLEAFHARAGALPPPGRAVALPTRLAGQLALADLRCAGSLELLGVRLRGAEGGETRLDEALYLRNCRVGGDLSVGWDRPLRHEVDALSDEDLLDLRLREGDDVTPCGSVLDGGVFVGLTRVAGLTRFDDALITGHLCLEDAELLGGFSAIDASLREAPGTGGFPGRVGLNNVRTRADVVLTGLVTPAACELSDSVVGGDLRFDAEIADAVRRQGARETRAGRLALTGNRVEGGIHLQGLIVEEDIDLGGTFAERGLRVVSGGEA